MDVVRVEWSVGRSPEQRVAPVVEITNAQQANVHVVLHDVPSENWGRGAHRATARVLFSKEA